MRKYRGAIIFVSFLLGLILASVVRSAHRKDVLMPDFPDWTRAFTMQGQDAEGNPVTILLDTDGQMYVVLRGEDAGGEPQTVKVDSDGQLYIIMRGESGNYLLVDNDGYMSALLKGQDVGGEPQTVKVDSDGQLYTVMRGASGYDLLVDSDGYMVAVLKGEYGGDLTTLGVDAQGRIQVFILDAVDKWGLKLPIGNAELAARMGSAVTHDWRGQVLMVCDFSNGIPHGLKDLGSGDGTVSCTPDYCVSGGYSMALVVSSASPYNAGLNVYLGPCPSSRVGGSMRFSLKDSPAYIQIGLTAQMGDVSHYGKVRVDLANDKLQYYDSVGAWQNAGDIDIWAKDYVFYSFKLVIDNDTGKYVRVLVNDVEFDLSAYDLVNTGGAYNPLLSFTMDVYGSSGQTDGAYVDSFIVTCNEP